MDNWAICYQLVDGEYQWVDAGKNIVITEEYDKVIPVREHVARQASKLIYDADAKKLRLKDGETLLTKRQLDEQQEALDKEHDLITNNHSKLVEVEF